MKYNSVWWRYDLKHVRHVTLRTAPIDGKLRINKISQHELVFIYNTVSWCCRSQFTKRVSSFCRVRLCVVLLYYAYPHVRYAMPLVEFERKQERNNVVIIIFVFLVRPGDSAHLHSNWIK